MVKAISPLDPHYDYYEVNLKSLVFSTNLRVNTSLKKNDYFIPPASATKSRLSHPCKNQLRIPLSIESIQHLQLRFLVDKLAYIWVLWCHVWRSTFLKEVALHLEISYPTLVEESQPFLINSNWKSADSRDRTPKMRSLSHMNQPRESTSTYKMIILMDFNKYLNF